MYDPIATKTYSVIISASLGIIFALLSAVSSIASAGEIVVANAKMLRSAIASAKPGDRILVMPGKYKLRKQLIRNGGVQGKPITVTALIPAQTRILTNSVELFKLRAPHWVFQNLTFVGTGATHHAFHIVGNADHVVIKGNRFLNFHSAIKANPSRGQVPDYITIERNIFSNDAPRQTTAPTTPIDVVGGTGWILRENFIADFGRIGDNSVSYAAFLKGGSNRGLIERNLVICERRHSGGRRVGLSFGGGGSARNLRSSDNIEHDDGIIRNNIIMNCPNAPGIYIKRSRNSKIYNNTIYNAFGIMAFYSPGISYIRNNIVSGAINKRSGARIVAGTNLTTGTRIGAYIRGGTLKLTHRISDYHVKYPNLFNASNIEWAQNTIESFGAWLSRSRVGRGVEKFPRWFVAPQIADFGLVSGAEIIGQGDALREVPNDFCGRSRKEKAVDLGAIEYRMGRCDVQAWVTDLFRQFE